jgi:hypothetical protein
LSKKLGSLIVFLSFFCSLKSLKNQYFDNLNDNGIDCKIYVGNLIGFFFLLGSSGAQIKQMNTKRRSQLPLPVNRRQSDPEPVTASNVAIGTVQSSADNQGK